MLLQRTLHVALALVFVTGTFAVMNANTSAKAPAPTRALSAPTDTSVGQALTAATPSLKREVFGFGLASSLNDPVIGYPSWNFSLLSTVAYFKSEEHTSELQSQSNLVCRL